MWLTHPIPHVSHRQHWFFLHTGADCGADTIHGFKEIRYTTRRTLDFMRDAFPSARFVVNVRKQVR